MLVAPTSCLAHTCHTLCPPVQRESESLAAHQDALDTFLVHELESQNTCPVCYELMVPPDHAPMMLFPCGEGVVY